MKNKKAKKKQQQKLYKFWYLRFGSVGDSTDRTIGRTAATNCRRSINDAPEIRARVAGRRISAVASEQIFFFLYFWRKFFFEIPRDGG